MPSQLTLTKTDQARLARIAREADRTPEEVLRFILDNGIGESTLILKKVAASRAAAARGEVAPHDVAMKRFRAVVLQNGRKPKKAA